MWLVGFLEKSRIGQQSQRHGAVPVIQPANGEIFRTLLIFEEFKKFYGFDGDFRVLAGFDRGSGGAYK